MTKPVLLDLYCKAGGAARGYQDAGFEVVGVDLEPQKRYVGEAFILGNAIAAMDVLLCGGELTDSAGRSWRLSDFAAIHASPPCQGYSVMRNLPWLKANDYPLLIEPTRELLEAAGLPWVIENVAGAKFGANMTARGLAGHGLQAGYLCGQMFGIPILRHRYFESNFLWLMPGHHKHWGSVRTDKRPGGRSRDFVTLEDGRVRTKTEKAGLARVQDWQDAEVDVEASHDEAGRPLGKRRARKGVSDTAHGVGHASWGIALVRKAMGIDWMIRDELTQAIPPIMTKYIGGFLMSAVAGSQQREKQGA